MIRLHRVRFIPFGFAFYLLTACEVFAASASMTVPQMALYQGADREKILIEGAKREGQLTLYDSYLRQGFREKVSVHQGFRMAQ
jgi:hypothetical protein